MEPSGPETYLALLLTSLGVQVKKRGEMVCASGDQTPVMHLELVPLIMRK